MPRTDCWRVRPAMVDDNFDDNRDDSCAAQYGPYSPKARLSCLVTPPARSWQCGGRRSSVSAKGFFRGGRGLASAMGVINDRRWSAVVHVVLQHLRRIATVSREHRRDATNKCGAPRVFVGAFVLVRGGFCCGRGRRMSNSSATPRLMIAVTVSQPQRIRVATEVRSVRWANHSTMCSKSWVCRAPGRAQGSSPVRTPQFGHSTRRIS